MLDESTPTTDPASDTSTTTTDAPPAARARSRRRAVSRPAGPPAPSEPPSGDAPSAETTAAEEAVTAAAPPAKKTARKATKKATAKKVAADRSPTDEPTAAEEVIAPDPPVAKTTRRRATKKATAVPADQPGAATEVSGAPAVSLLFQPPDTSAVATGPARAPTPAPDPVASAEIAADADDSPPPDTAADAEEQTSRRRRRRGGRRRRKPTATEEAAGEPTAAAAAVEEAPAEVADRSASTGPDPEATSEATSEGGTRRRRRRRRSGEDTEPAPDDPADTVVRVRTRRTADNEITSVEGSTRLEAKKQRRREGRESGRRRAPIVSEAEFLARREAVKREMVIRQRGDITQIAVVEDDVLVEHYVARESQTSLIGNVYLGRVQNVLPSMEAAFVDIGKGRNAVLYAGEVDWKALGRDGKPRKIEDALKSGQSVLVQVTKDPVGQKGARLTSQISLPGRFLVYVPEGQTSGISRKLPDTERNRLKSLMRGLLPEDAGVIIRTAAEGASEEQLTRDVTALTARWEDIAAKSKAGKAPQLLYGEPDLMIKVVRDLFNEDFQRLVVDGDDAWDMVQGYVTHVAPDLGERLQCWGGDSEDTADVFAAYRIDDQIAKGLDRKVFLPSGGSLVIDRTEAMTVVDVNTGKFTGSGGNLEETVTKNNLEAAEEFVRQLRLRDIGGIIVIDFIDMVLEDNRDLVLRRLVECLGRDRTRHQVAEVTSLGLVQMTRKRIGTGLLEAFSEPCEHCRGRGVTLHTEPIELRSASDDDDERRSRGRGKASEGRRAAATKTSHDEAAPAMAGATT